jgi:flagellar hook-basal body complex protein FliE
MPPIAPIDTNIPHLEGFRDGAKTVDIHNGSTSFAEVMEGVVTSANAASKFEGRMSEAFAAGVRDDIHGTMIALGKADIEMKFVGSVRNKVIDAFYELWRMQI